MPAKVRVTAIQRLCVNDGPGVRTVVFLKGCYLKCPWCCNPEAIHYDQDIYFDKGICLYPNGGNICKNCELHGGTALRSQCPLGSYEKTYHDYETAELYNLLLRDEAIYRDGGGITFSGGEPLLQAFEIKPLLLKLKEKGIHIAFETTLYAPVDNYQSVRDLVDFWIIDLKFQYGFIPNTDYHLDISNFESNIHIHQSERKQATYRMVIMTEVMDRLDNVIKLLKDHQIDDVELLACHGLAENKYKEIKSTFRRFLTPGKTELDKACEMMRLNGINAHYVTL